MEQTTDDVESVPADVQAAVDAALERVEAMVAADPELVHGDAVEIVALETPVEVAVALCQQSMNFVPDTIRRRLFEAENADTISAGAAASAERDAAEKKAQQRSSRAAATRAKTLAAEAAVASEAIKSATCPVCFTVRAASGVCGCD
ncbi:MAG: hypothetical protein JWN35_2884 [Frankiales bacterium]|nr:hypothetical protein [Frankiales bacterium]